MKCKTIDLIDDLKKRTKQIIIDVEKFQQLSNSQLNWKSNPDSWSILECLEHLNLYSDFYLPEIQERIKNSKSKPVQNFKSGLLGNYFANSLLPKEQLNKMKTFKDKNPLGSNLDKSVIDKFLEYQKLTLELLDQSNLVNLNKTKTSITISKWIKLKLGDTFRVVIYHNQRHIVQAQKVLVKQAS